jgi:hypothetical protein
MGLLNNTDWQNIANTARATFTPAPISGARSITPKIPTPKQIGTAVQPYVPKVKFNQEAYNADFSHPDFRSKYDTRAQEIIDQNKLSEQEQIQKYGGVVGSPEYYSYKSKQNIYGQVAEKVVAPVAAAGVAGFAVGGPPGALAGLFVGAGIGPAAFPDDKTWDSLTNQGKIDFLINQTKKNAINMVTSAPVEFARGVAKVIATPYEAVAESIKQGRPADYKSMVNRPELEIPGIGKIPTLFQSHEQCLQQSGGGKLACMFQTIGSTAGDVAMAASLAEAGTQALRGFKNKGATPTSTEAAPLTNPQAVKEVINRDGSGRATGVSRAPDGSPSEYYSLPKTMAKEYGGGAGDTHYKMTPATSNTVEVSVVQRRPGAKVGAIDKKTGGVITQGDFGPEVKIQSQVLKLDENSAQALKLDQAESAKPPSVPGKPVKGTENQTVSDSELQNLFKIGDANNVPSVIRDEVIRAVSGKNVMGEMTKQEYTNAAKALTNFNDINKIVPPEAKINPFGQYIHPLWRFLRSIESRNPKVPVYSEGYVKLERAHDVKHYSDTLWDKRISDATGDFTGPDYQRAIYKYLDGDQSAITNNTYFSPEDQVGMVQVANNYRALFDEAGPLFNAPKEIHISNYVSHIQDIGGIYQLFKEDVAGIKGGTEAFFKEKRSGNTAAPNIEHAQAVLQMYTRAGSNATYVKPVLDSIKTMSEGIPSTAREALTSYVKERTGELGKVDKLLSDVTKSLNEKIGARFPNAPKLPADASRQVGDLYLSTQYSSLLSQPGTWYKQTLQDPMYGYASIGSKFLPESVAELANPRSKAFSAAWDKARERGILIDTSAPYGGELARESSVAGGSVKRVINFYKSATQTVIKPNSFADNIGRVRFMRQYEMQFNDALKRLNEGEIQYTNGERRWSSWVEDVKHPVVATKRALKPAFEDEVGLSDMANADKSIVRQLLAKGDAQSVEQALQHLVRAKIDESYFPYRKGSGPTTFHGIGGKAVGSLFTYPLEATHTIGQWFSQALKTGDFSKVIRFYAASTAINRTMERALGVNFGKTVFLGPVLSTTDLKSPFVKMVASGITAAMQAPVLDQVGGENNRKLFNDNKDAFIKSVETNFAIGGLQLSNFGDFKKIINRGPDPKTGKYIIRYSDGGQKYATDFYGVVMGELFGFPIDEKVQSSEEQKKASNLKEDSAQLKQDAMVMLSDAQDERDPVKKSEMTKKAFEFAQKNNVNITDQDIKDWGVDSTLKLFKGLPKNVRSQF